MADVQAYLSQIGDFSSESSLEMAKKSKPVQAMGTIQGTILALKGVSSKVKSVVGTAKDVVDKAKNAVEKGKQIVSDTQDKLNDATKPKQDFTDMLDEMDEPDVPDAPEFAPETAFGTEGGVVTTDETTAQEISQNAGGTYRTVDFDPNEEEYDLDGPLDSSVDDLGSTISDAVGDVKNMVTGVGEDLADGVSSAVSSVSDTISGGVLATEGVLQGVVDAIPVIGEIAAPFLALASIGTEIGEALNPGSKPSGPQLQTDV